MASHPLMYIDCRHWVHANDVWYSLHGKLNFPIWTIIDNMTVVCDVKNFKECIMSVISSFIYMQWFSGLYMSYIMVLIMWSFNAQ